MTEEVKTVNLNSDIVMTQRNVIVDRVPISISVNQITGEYLLTYPRDDSGSFGGDVIMYPQSPDTQIHAPITIKDFYQTSSLYRPLDARFDYVRGKIWITDSTGDGRVIKVKKELPRDVDVIVEDLIYPHAIAPNLNTGGAFIKAFNGDDRVEGVIYILKSNGDESDSLVFQNDFPAEPSPYSIVFDHIRSRVWWVAGSKIYMADVKNFEVHSFNVQSYGFSSVYTIDVELATGNTFVVAGDNHDERFVLQMFRDNNSLLASAYLE
jgi:hypothetical protein